MFCDKWQLFIGSVKEEILEMLVKNRRKVYGTGFYSSKCFCGRGLLVFGKVIAPALRLFIAVFFVSIDIYYQN